MTVLKTVTYVYFLRCHTIFEHDPNSKNTPRQRAGRKGGQTLFHRILLATARGLASTTAVEWHLKVKDIE